MGDCSLSDDLSAISSVTNVSLSTIQEAQKRISSYVHRTPVFTCSQLDKPTTKFFFKAESLQKTGSFKFRGAINAISMLKSKPLGTPIVTHSSGNHAQAIAAASKLLHRKAFLVVPENASAVKVNAAAGYGAAVIRCQSNPIDRAEVAKEVVQEVKGEFIHPSQDSNVISGQGTIGLELLDQVPDLDAIVVPIGGGGMISGISIAAKAINPMISIIGAEPLLGNAAYRSLEKRQHTTIVDRVETIADGLRASIGKVTWEVVSRLVDKVITVEESEIVDATLAVFERMKLVVEPSAGAAVAATQKTEFLDLNYSRVGVILCGGNVDLHKLPWLSKTC